MSTTIYLNNISLVAPGLYGWQASQDVLCEKTKYRFEELPKLTPAILPANERRRTTPLIKLALHAAEECLDSNLEAASGYATVFASSDGDMGIMDKICRTLTLPDHPVSPTNFHNSVHNAPAGYWAIAAKAQQNSNSLSGANESFASGLVETASYVAVEGKPVLYVAYDMPGPEPLDSARHLETPFATAMVFSTSKQNNSIAELTLELSNDTNFNQCSNTELETMRAGNPVARALPLLQLLAKKQNSTVVIPHMQSTALNITVKNFA